MAQKGGGGSGPPGPPPPIRHCVPIYMTILHNVSCTLRSRPNGTGSHETSKLDQNAPKVGFGKQNGNDVCYLPVSSARSVPVNVLPANDFISHHMVLHSE